MPRRFCCFGSLNLDYVYAMPHFVRPGETLDCLRREVGAGGKGLNQSCALAHAGASVFHAGCVGKDGALLLETLKRHGADVSHVLTVDEPTGHAVIQVDQSGENCIILCGGANRAITEVQMDSALSSFSSGDILVLQNEINGVARLMEKGKERDLRIAFNPSPFDGSILSLPLSTVDYLFVNEIEGAALTGFSPQQEDQIIARLSESFPSSEVILTLGGKGAVCACGGKVYRQAAVKTQTVDTTAAGDTFTGFYLTARAEGLDIPGALRLAAAAASITVSRKGAADAIPYRAEVFF